MISLLQFFDQLIQRQFCRSGLLYEAKPHPKPIGICNSCSRNKLSKYHMEQVTHGCYPPSWSSLSDIHESNKDEITGSKVNFCEKKRTFCHFLSCEAQKKKLYGPHLLLLQTTFLSSPKWQIIIFRPKSAVLLSFFHIWLQTNTAIMIFSHSWTDQNYIPNGVLHYRLSNPLLFIVHPLKSAYLSREIHVWNIIISDEYKK